MRNEIVGLLRFIETLEKVLKILLEVLQGRQLTQTGRELLHDLGTAVRYNFKIRHCPPFGKLSPTYQRITAGLPEIEGSHEAWLDGLFNQLSEVGRGVSNPDFIKQTYRNCSVLLAELKFVLGVPEEIVVVNKPSGAQHQPRSIPGG